MPVANARLSDRMREYVQGQIDAVTGTVWEVSVHMGDPGSDFSHNELPRTGNRVVIVRGDDFEFDAPSKGTFTFALHTMSGMPIVVLATATMDIGDRLTLHNIQGICIDKNGGVHPHASL